MLWPMEDSQSTEEGADRVPTFRIQETEFEAPFSTGTDDVLSVRSSPRPYDVTFASPRPLTDVIEEFVAQASEPVVLADQRAVEAHLRDVPSLAGAPIMAVEATEEFKSVESALN